MHRRLVVASAIAVVVMAAFLTGSGAGSSAVLARGAQKIPAGLGAAIHARLGSGPIRLAARATAATVDPHLGISVALSADGTTAIAGAPGVAGYKGAAYIFHTSDAGSWSSSQVPTAALSHKPGPAQAKLLGYQLFGAGVALSPDGKTAFVGAPFVLVGKSLATIGVVYVFQSPAEDAWSSSSKPTATLTATGGGFVGVTLAVSADGATLVTGAPLANGDLGAAYVFHASSESAWASTSTPAAALTNAAEDSSTDSSVGGAGVAISGDGTTVLVSDSENMDTGGGAYVYHVAAADAWTSRSTPTAILSDAGGATLALSQDGTVAFLGSPGAPDSLEVFRVAGEDAWVSTSTPTATLTAAGGSLGDEYAVPPAVSADGTTVLVSAANAPARGGAYIFRVANEAAWVTTSSPTAALTNSGSQFSDGAGSVALSADGATALVGDPGFLKYTGAGDLFHAADANSWVSASTPTAILTDKALAACVVPKLKGLKLSAAKQALAAGRCNLGKVAKVHAKSKKRRGRVLSQSKKPGRRLAIGAKISIKVGK